MAAHVPTFGLDGSELDVMDGLFFNELTDLPVEPAPNAQFQAKPAITDEELIASLPLPPAEAAPPAAAAAAKPARGAAKDAADLSETRRARNREHARRSRCRKKAARRGNRYTALAAARGRRETPDAPRRTS